MKRFRMLIFVIAVGLIMSVLGSTKSYAEDCVVVETPVVESMPSTHVTEIEPSTEDTENYEHTNITNASKIPVAIAVDQSNSKSKSNHKQNVAFYTYLVVLLLIIGIIFVIGFLL